MRVLLEKTVHDRLSRDNDTILAALEGGLRWHRKRQARRRSGRDGARGRAVDRPALRLRHARAGPRGVAGARAVGRRRPGRPTRSPVASTTPAAGYPAATFAPRRRRRARPRDRRRRSTPTGRAAALVALDRYEGDEYERIAVRTAAGRRGRHLRLDRTPDRLPAGRRTAAGAPEPQAETRPPGGR